jgi:hypothetical protein
VLLLLSICETDLLSAGSFPAPVLAAAAAVVVAGLLDAAFSRRWCAAKWPLTGGAGHRALLTNLQSAPTVGVNRIQHLNLWLSPHEPLAPLWLARLRQANYWNCNCKQKTAIDVQASVH